MGSTGARSQMQISQSDFSRPARRSTIELSVAASCSAVARRTLTSWGVVLGIDGSGSAKAGNRVPRSLKYATLTAVSTPKFRQTLMKRRNEARPLMPRCLADMCLPRRNGVKPFLNQAPDRGRRVIFEDTRASGFPLHRGRLRVGYD